ncbi:sterol desaturase family protein [Evansella halocellulosilytica]|uniref:sterol desaturase family protein n=1 Tax=Evansella halocellulosilytica TaxID=2011013 RepID=UPI000BB706FC|nr:sterol desaturase family protein [Evansella halocellulosilytica]
MKLKYVKEFFFFPDILVISFIFFISVAITIVHISSIYTWVALFIGVGMYTLSEYTTHRFLFHMKPPKNTILLKLIKRLHYDHHTNPNDLHLLFLPLWYTLPQLIIVSTIIYLITSSLIMTNSVMTGVILSLLYYEWKHYIAHRPLQPWTVWGRWMKKNHLLHHFKNENYWYGVTNPSMDFIMGTFKDEKNVKKSETANNLEARKVDKESKSFIYKSKQTDD